MQVSKNSLITCCYIAWHQMFRDVVQILKIACAYNIVILLDLFIDPERSDRSFFFENEIRKKL